MEQFSLRKFVCQILVKLRFENAISSKVKPDFGLVYTVISKLSAPHTIPTSHHNASLLVKWAIVVSAGQVLVHFLTFDLWAK